MSLYFAFVLAIFMAIVHSGSADAPYTSAYQCPSPKVLTTNCSTCSGDDVCCDSVCTKGVLPPRPCDVLVANIYPAPLGAYVPQCSADGNFEQIQCQGSTGYCWCVDISNGKPLSAPVGPGQRPNCTLTGSTDLSHPLSLYAFLFLLCLNMYVH